jgi:hypothetical protein
MRRFLARVLAALLRVLGTVYLFGCPEPLSAHSLREIHPFMEDSDDLNMSVGNQIYHRVTAAAHFAQAGPLGAELRKAQREFAKRFDSFAQLGDVDPGLRVTPFCPCQFGDRAQLG